MSEQAPQHEMQHPDSPTWCIPLTQEKIAIVDESDYESLSKHKWHAVQRGATWYAARSEGGRKHKRAIYMHRQILGLSESGVPSVDHHDGNGLNNRKYNLRPCTKSQNSTNAKTQINVTSVYKGVFRDGKRWRVQISIRKKRVHVGRFNDEVEAAAAYNLAAQEHYGQFAKLNDLRA